jgi:hypothetical protein
MIYHEEEAVEGKVPIAAGKVEWYTVEDVKKLVPKLAHLFNEKPQKENILLLKEEIKKARQKQGVVYFSDDRTVYRYKISTSGKLKEIGINFHHLT